MIARVKRQQGMSLTGFIFVLGLVGILGVFGMKIVPTAIEYNAIKGAIVKAKAAATTPREIRASYDKLADTGYIESVKGQDLEIGKIGDELEVSFAYQKKIAIFGPASLLLEYAGSTSKPPLAKNPVEK